MCAVIRFSNAFGFSNCSQLLFDSTTTARSRKQHPARSGEHSRRPKYVAGKGPLKSRWIHAVAVAVEHGAIHGIFRLSSSKKLNTNVKCKLPLVLSGTSRRTR